MKLNTYSIVKKPGARWYLVSDQCPAAERFMGLGLDGKYAAENEQAKLRSAAQGYIQRSKLQESKVQSA